MKACRENLNKLKNLCNDLSDRDNQLKINATTLWDILEGIHGVREILVSVQAESGQEEMDEAINRLSGILELVTERGCKKVLLDDR